MALAVTEIESVVHRLPNRAEPDHLAAVELMPGTSNLADLELAAAIVRRRTDRRGSPTVHSPPVIWRC